MRITAAVASLAVLCALAACVQAKSAARASQPLKDVDPAEEYCKQCVNNADPLYPRYRLIRGTDEVKLCDDGYYCDCENGKKKRCTGASSFAHMRFNPDKPASLLCELNFNCTKWMNDNPVTPTPVDPTSPAPVNPSSSSPDNPSSPAPDNPSSSSPDNPSSSSPDNPSSSSPDNPSSPAPVNPSSSSPDNPSSSSPDNPSSPAPVNPSSATPVDPSSTTTVDPSSTTTVDPSSTTTVDPSSTTTVDPSSTTTVDPSSTTTVDPSATTQKPKPRPNAASWAQRSSVGLLCLGVVVSVL